MVPSLTRLRGADAPVAAACAVLFTLLAAHSFVAAALRSVTLTPATVAARRKPVRKTRSEDSRSRSTVTDSTRPCNQACAVDLTCLRLVCNNTVQQSQSSMHVSTSSSRVRPCSAYVARVAAHLGHAHDNIGPGWCAQWCCVGDVREVEGAEQGPGELPSERKRRQLQQRPTKLPNAAVVLTVKCCGTAAIDVEVQQTKLAIPCLRCRDAVTGTAAINVAVVLKRSRQQRRSKGQAVQRASTDASLSSTDRVLHDPHCDAATLTTARLRGSYHVKSCKETGSSTIAAANPVRQVATMVSIFAPVLGRACLPAPLAQELRAYYYMYLAMEMRPRLPQRYTSVTHLQVAGDHSPMPSPDRLASTIERQSNCSRQSRLLTVGSYLRLSVRAAAQVGPSAVGHASSRHNSATSARASQQPRITTSTLRKAMPISLCCCEPDHASLQRRRPTIVRASH